MTHCKNYAKTILLAVLVTLLLSSPVFAQNVGDNNQKGIPPFGTFHGSNFDTVSFQNGNLNIRIPIVSLPQRLGRNSALTYVYNSPTWTAGKTIVDPSGTELWTVGSVNLDSSFWNMNSSSFWEVNYELVDRQCTWTSGVTNQTYYVDYYLYRNFAVTDPTGAKHPFLLRYETYDPQDGPCTAGDLPHGNLLKGISTDGTGIQLDITAGPESGIVTLKDGTIGWSQDTNGNFIGAMQVNNSTFGSDPGYPPDNETWTFKNSNGDPQTYRVDYMTVNIQTNFCPIVPISPPNTCQEGAAGGPVRVPFKLTLPNGKFYQFTWAQNSYAELLRVDLPTGGYITYAYESRAYLVRHKPDHSGITQNTETYDLRREVNTRTVYDGQVSRTWTYTRLSGTPAPMLVHDPLGDEQVHYFSKIGDSSYDSLTQYYKGAYTGGLLLRTEFKEYASELGPLTYDDVLRPVINVRLMRETTTLDDGKQSKVETDYETIPVTGYYGYTATRLNVSEKREYAYGSGQPGSLVRRTTYAFLHPGNQPYLDRNITDRVTTTMTYDGAGNVVAQSQNEYDNYTEGISTSGAVAHNPAYNSGFTTRGNVTASKRWRNSDGAWLTTRHQYDDLGNIIKTTDPLGHITTFDYTDAWANSVCAPAGQSRIYPKETKNHLNHRVWNTWNSCTGTLASTRNENDILDSRAGTTYTYDFADRLDITTMPDGGQTDNDYDDTNRIVTSKVKKDSSGTFITSRAIYDVLGRVWRAEQCEDGSTCAQVIRTDTTFDALGRKETVTNPYRPGVSAPTDGVTKFKYDALGRATRVIPPDGNEALDTNVVKTDYSGNVTTVTDQAGKQRRSFTDALGRLIQVDEPGGGGPATFSTGSALVNAVNPSGGVQTYNINAIAAIGSVTLSGNEQSTQSQSQSATPSTGSITVNGAEQSTQVQTSPATAGTGLVNITGTEQGAWVTVQVWGCLLWDESGGCLQEGWIDQQQWQWDSGSVGVTVNGNYKAVSYGYGSTGTSIAAALANAINADGSHPASASSSGTVVYLTSKATGAATNYSLSVSSYSSDPGNFDPPSFVPSPSGSTLTGGANAQNTTVYDSGTVSATVNGFTAQASFGSGSTTSTIAAALRNVFNTNGSSPVTAGGTGATVSLTSKTAGSGTNYALSVAWSYNTSYFGAPSFTASKSGNNMTGGSDAAYTTVYDSGTVTITVNGVNKAVSYGQGSSTTTIASALATAIANDGAYPATASASGATVNLTARTAGTVGNGYSLNASTTYNTTYFGSPSFTTSKSGNTLAGAVDGSVVYDSGTVTLTIAGCTPFTVNYSNGSTRASIAAALRDAVNASGPCPVTASVSGNTVNLVSDATGASVNFGLSWSAATSQSSYFASPSFSLAPSGMSGGADFIPMSLSTPAVTLYTYDTLDLPPEN